MDRSVSIIVACLNEAENLDGTITNIMAAVTALALTDYEILIFNDGSTDDTGVIADRHAAANPNIKAIHNGRNRGFGYNFMRGVEIASKTHVAIFPGDNEISPRSIVRILSCVGVADMVIPHTINMEIRPYGRRMLSRLFTLMMNSIFNMELMYYNGPCVHKRDLLRQANVKTTGFAFSAVTLVKLILTGHSFVEVEMYLQPKHTYRSSALKIKNVLSVVKSVIKLTAAVYLNPDFKRTEAFRRVMPPA